MDKPTKPMGAVEQLTRAFSPTHATDALPKRERTPSLFEVVSDAVTHLRKQAFRVFHDPELHQLMLATADKLEADAMAIVEARRAGERG